MLRPEIFRLILILSIYSACQAFTTVNFSLQTKNVGWKARTRIRISTVNPFVSPSLHLVYALDPETLMDMDIVVYCDELVVDGVANDDDSMATKATRRYRLGAIQEDMMLAPLSVWSTDPQFDDFLEFVVDEEDRFPGVDPSKVQLVRLIPPESLYFGSRQVGGGKGPGNPHGEESELLYYVKEQCVQDVELAVKPELEILW